MKMCVYTCQQHDHRYQHPTEVIEDIYKSLHYIIPEEKISKIEEK